MNYEIKVNQLNKRYGFIEGTINQYDFAAEISKENVPEGINIQKMDKGNGKIRKLCIFRDEVENTGNPFLPVMSVKRHIFIEYEDGWKVYNFTFQNMVSELIHYLDRRSTINIVR